VACARFPLTVWKFLTRRYRYQLTLFQRLLYGVGGDLVVERHDEERRDAPVRSPSALFAEPTLLSSGLKVGRSRLNFVPAFIALASSPVVSTDLTSPTAATPSTMYAPVLFDGYRSMPEWWSERDRQPRT
jgi:hypothetical protein